MLAITGNLLTLDRGGWFFELVTTVTRMCSNVGLDNLNKFLLPVQLQPLKYFSQHEEEVQKWVEFVADAKNDEERL